MSGDGGAATPRVVFGALARAAALQADHPEWWLVTRWSGDDDAAMEVARRDAADTGERLSLDELAHEIGLSAPAEQVPPGAVLRGD